MLLATSQDVIARMRLNNRSSSVEAAESVLRAATLICANILGTDFEEDTRIDYFSVNVGRFSDSHNLKFYTEKGFLHSNPDIEVFHSDPGKSIRNTQEYFVDLLEPEEYLVDYERGEVTVLPSLNRGIMNLAIKYSRGFELGTGRVYRGTPEWLQEAAITAAIRVLNVSAVPTKENLYLRYTHNMLTTELTSILNEHSRPRHNGLFPAKSEVVTP